MLRVVVVTCCLVALTFGASECWQSAGIPDVIETSEFQQWSGRIVGGSTAGTNQFRYMASLRTAANAHFCGGALFSPRWVVSAAHCTLGRSAADVRIVLGAQSRTVGGTTFTVSRIINHPQFNSGTLANDVSLLESATTIVTTAAIAPAVLGSTFLGGGVQVTASGWGQQGHPGTLSTLLQFVVLSTLTNADCRSRFSTANANRVYDNTVCTFTREGQGTCMGDSGGPIAAANTIHGIVSWGIACAVGSPDVFARIGSHRAWISGQTGV